MKPLTKAEPIWFDLLGAPSGPTDKAWVFSDDSMLHSNPLVSRKPLTVMPGFGPNDRGIQTFDKPYLNFLRKLVDRLNKDCQVGLDAKLFPLPGHLHTDFSTLLTPAGYSMAPMSLAPVNNALFVESLGLPSDFRSPRHKAIFDKFADMIFSRWKVCSIKTAKLSTSGTPTWVPNARLKREHAVFLLANEREVMKRYRSGDMTSLAAYAKVVFMMNAGRRDQLDKVGKERLVFPYEYALSSGRKGHPVVADKRVVIDGVEYPDFAATRARLFHGGPYAANLYPQIIATGTLHGGLFEQWPETFHCTDVVAAVEAIPLGEDMRCSDATEYDRSMATFLIKRLFDRARAFWREDLINWTEHLCFACYFSRPVNLKGSPNNPAVLMGDPWSDKDQVFRGNPSGHAWTSLIAKIMMVFDFLATADDLMHDVLENMDAYLRHRRSLKTKNNGDDGMFHGPDRLLNEYVAYRFNKEDNPGYFVLEAEVGNIWSGYVTSRRPDGGFTANSRPQTSLAKILCPERSAGSNFRKQPSIGIIQRIVGGNHPYHDRMIEIFFSTWSEWGSPHYGDFMELVYKHHERLGMNMSALTAIDMEVLEKPELLYYRYTEDEVSEGVIAMLFEQALSPAEILPFVTSNYNGSIIGDSYGNSKVEAIH